jgi:hypothetical protein
LPKGRFFVTVTEQQHFDKIEETIPGCVQTRLDEFMSGPGKQWGVKVYYLKPLCVEVDDKLLLTSQEDLTAAIAKIQAEVFAEYREQAFVHRTTEAVRGAVNFSLSAPRQFASFLIKRRQKALDAYQAKLEFKRRKTALAAAKLHRKCRTNECTFDQMLELTNPLDRTDVIEQYCVEQELSRAKRDQLLLIAAGTVPWFVLLSLGASYLATLTWTTTPTVVACDPAFVAEMPGSNGVLLKIGHFDEVAGVTHVEI